MAVTTKPKPPGARFAPPADDADPTDPFVRRLADPGVGKREARSRRDIVAGLELLDIQRDRATEADEMYEGDVGMVYASRQVKQLLSKQGVDADDIPDLNYAHIPVDVIADRLHIAAVKVEPAVTEEEAADDPDSDTAAASADEKTLKRARRQVKKLRRANKLDVYEKYLHMKVSVHGDAFLFLWPVQDAKGKIVSVDFRVHTAHEVVFVYDPEDTLQVSYVIKSWTVDVADPDDGRRAKNVTRVNLYYPGPRTIGPDGELAEGAGRVERWTTEPGGNAKRPEDWKRVHGTEDLEGEEVERAAADEFGDPDEPFAKDDIPSPFGLTWFHFRNGVPCGVPEHRNAYGPQVLINKLVWSHAGVIEYQGYPQRYLLADPKVDDPLFNSVNPDHPEDEDDDPEDRGASAGLDADPAAVWKLYGKSTGEYSAADPRTFMDPLDRYIKSMSELTPVPQYRFTKASGDVPSGEALREIDAPMLTTVKDRQTRYDPTWEDSYELALRMLNITGVAVDVRWTPASVVNDSDGVNVLKGKRELGVPDEVLLNEAGYPDDQVTEWLKSKEGGSVEGRLASLSTLGMAVQALAAGVTAGVVDEAGAMALVSRLLRLIADGTVDPEPSEGALPAPKFREPPPTNPAMAAVEAGKADPLKQAQVAATHATTETSRASAEMMRGGAPVTGPGRPADPRKATKANPRRSRPVQRAAGSGSQSRPNGGGTS